ncbi:MAG: ATP-binding cassette domain-containing protein [Flavobacteriaceae bacterium]|jgi:NHLM bacteriocin system ABC transporter peptidase/ATP-binding protein|nr:ATP-binding cassette domain-containing protein [Flavobacteriaceae bacterium]
MNKTPVYLISDKGQSGAICLAMILAHYGSFPKLNTVQTACNSGTNEVAPKNLQEAAIRFGFNVKLGTTSIEKISVVNPIIIKKTSGKYILITKENKSYYSIHDPEKGFQKIKKQTLKNSYDSWSLELIPGNDFKIIKQETSFYKEIKKRIIPNFKAMLYVIIAGLILIIPAIIIPAFNKLFFDDIILLSQKQWYHPMLSILSIFIVLGSILVYFQQRLLLEVYLKSSIIESAKFVRHLFSLPYNYFHNHTAGKTVNLIGLNSIISSLLTKELATVVLNCVSILFYGIVMLKFNWLLSLVGVSIMLLNIFALRYFSAKRTALNQSLFKKQQTTFSIATNGIEQIETLKASGSENDFFSLWSSHLVDSINDEQKLGITSRILAVLPDFISQFNNVVVLLLGGLLIMKGEITIGVFIALQSFIASFSAPVKGLVAFTGSLQINKSNINHLIGSIQEPIDVFCDDNTKESINKITPANSKLTGKLEVKNISFGYSIFNEPLIKNFSLTAYPGKKIAIVGGSGSGKSTLLKIISGLYTPLSGEIIYDGKPINTINKDVFRNSLSVVQQDGFFFTGTITDNITMWNSSINNSEIINSAKDAEIHNIISERVGGYNSKVAPDGRNFSGGQKQRLEIARALVSNPSILFLDEATSALDTETEKIVMNNFKRRNCTTITIAHRLSTIKDFDEIIVLDKGNVLQRGSHEDLIKNEDGLYYNLIKKT